MQVPPPHELLSVHAVPALPPELNAAQPPGVMSPQSPVPPTAFVNLRVVFEQQLQPGTVVVVVDSVVDVVVVDVLVVVGAAVVVVDSVVVVVDAGTVVVVSVVDVVVSTMMPVVVVVLDVSVVVVDPALVVVVTFGTHWQVPSQMKAPAGELHPLPGGSHCSPGSIELFPQVGSVVVVVVSVVDVLVDSVLVVSVVDVVVVTFGTH